MSPGRAYIDNIQQSVYQAIKSRNVWANLLEKYRVNLEQEPIEAFQIHTVRNLELARPVYDLVQAADVMRASVLNCFGDIDLLHAACCEVNEVLAADNVQIEHLGAPVRVPSPLAISALKVCSLKSAYSQPSPRRI